ncbi:hypothetical protein [Pararhodonellum marinum]|uniref:hypothetical protein n=1 Tax=Pararhodonellum marinum TaxID=2755358 RepID=UPI0018905D44|nr:hypothetical protein [Pararhodonellum marinum]
MKKTPKKDQSQKKAEVLKMNDTPEQKQKKEKATKDTKDKAVVGNMNDNSKKKK